MQPPKSFQSIEFQIKYSLRDYYLVIADHTPHAVREISKKSSAFTAWLICKVVPTISCLAALLSRKLKPTYSFLISNDGVRRRSGSQELFVSWDEIVRIRKYTTTFFIELKKGGAMPLPYRFLSEDHLNVLNGLSESE